MAACQAEGHVRAQLVLGHSAQQPQHLGLGEGGGIGSAHHAVCSRQVHLADAVCHHVIFHRKAFLVFALKGVGAILGNRV